MKLAHDLGSAHDLGPAHVLGLTYIYPYSNVKVFINNNCIVDFMKLQIPFPLNCESLTYVAERFLLVYTYSRQLFNSKCAFGSCRLIV